MNVAADVADIVAGDDFARLSPDTYGDAVKVTPYDPSDYETAFTATFGGSSKSTNWNPKNDVLAAIIGLLCQHREGRKDGLSIVFADMHPGQRLKNAVKSVTGIGLDLDVGAPIAEIDAAIAELGCCAVRYTTHSHNKTSTEIKKDSVIRFLGDGADINSASMRDYCERKLNWHHSMLDSVEYRDEVHNEKGIMVVIGHKPMPKNRIFIPMREPFEIAKEAPTQIGAMAKWAKVVDAMARLLGVNYDRACIDPSRLFYLPRHPKGRNDFSISVFGGPLFDRATLRLDDEFEALVAEGLKTGGKSKTAEGKALGKWSRTTAHGFQIADVLEDHCSDRLRGPGSNGFNIECPFDAEHGNAGDTSDRACFAVNAADGGNELFIVSCRHGSCGDKTNLDMLGKMIADRWFDKAVIDEPGYNIVADDDAGTRTGVIVSDGYCGALVFDSERGATPEGVSYNKETGAIHQSFRNALLLIGNEKWDLGYNELTQNFGMRGDGPYPWPEHLGYAFNDSIRREIRLYLLRRWGVTFSTEDVIEASLTLARRNAFNPVCDEMAELEGQWDGQSRLERLFETYFRVKVTDENREYVRAIGKIMLVAAVRRAREPGCKYDEMVILEGSQGCGKSTAVRVLAGQFFSDANLGDLTEKEAPMKLRGVWIQEFGELSAMKRGDVDELKEFLSHQSDRYKIPYAKFEEDFPRRCVFVGTVNPGGGAYMVDLTGNRRLWPVTCGEIDLAALERDRDQLWAEAAMMESRGDSIRLDPSLYNAAKAEQEARLADDPWVERLARYLEELCPEIGKRVLSIDLLSLALEVPAERQGQLATKKLKTAMSQIQTWQYKPSLRVDGVKSAGYEYVGKESAP